MARTFEEIRTEWCILGSETAARYRSLASKGSSGRTEKEGKVLDMLMREYFRHFDRRAPEDRAWLEGWHAVYHLMVVDIDVHTR